MAYFTTPLWTNVLDAVVLNEKSIVRLVDKVRGSELSWHIVLLVGEVPNQCGENGNAQNVMLNCAVIVASL